MYPLVLMCDVAGLPVEWIHWQAAATLYARKKVSWEAGSEFMVLTGGTRFDGSRSSLRVNSIIAVKDRSKKFTRVPPISNRLLFLRDGHLCLWCARKFPSSRLTADHIVARALGGKHEWTNLATCCVSCNQAKGSKSLEQWGRKLIAVPYVPDHTTYLLLSSGTRKVLVDQQAWLESFADPSRKLN